jgi:hypothetical protein
LPVLQLDGLTELGKLCVFSRRGGGRRFHAPLGPGLARHMASWVLIAERPAAICTHAARGHGAARYSYSSGPAAADPGRPQPRDARRFPIPDHGPGRRGAAGAGRDHAGNTTPSRDQIPHRPL